MLSVTFRRVSRHAMSSAVRVHRPLGMDQTFQSRQPQQPRGDHDGSAGGHEQRNRDRVPSSRTQGRGRRPTYGRGRSFSICGIAQPKTVMAF
jgi:hypothetical protein